MNICVIPARGGSKRIPRKNIKVFCGKPIIAYSIEAALNSDCFDKVIVSTDDTEIAEIAKNYGAEVPFVRPNQLSDDFTTTGHVMAHSVKTLLMEKNNDCIDYFCCLYATAPFVLPEDIRQSLMILEKNSDASFCFTVTDFGYPIQRAIKLSKNKRVSMFVPENYEKRSQDFEQAWHDAGQFYWGNTNAWLSHNPLFNSYSIGYPLPRYRVQDIDTLEDWKRAEWLYQAQQLSSQS